MKSLTKSLHVCPEQRRRAGPCRGFTLIELVIALSVLLIIFPPTLVIFYQIMQLKFRNEGRMVAVYLAQGVAEHMSQRRFTSVDDIPPTPFTASEISEGKPNPFQNLNFDDYSFQVEVDCVTYGADPNNLDIDTWAVDPACADPIAQDYRRVVVRVFFRNLQTLETIETITLTSLMTDTRDE